MPRGGSCSWRSLGIEDWNGDGMKGVCGWRFMRSDTLSFLRHKMQNIISTTAHSSIGEWDGEIHKWLRYRGFSLPSAVLVTQGVQASARATSTSTSTSPSPLLNSTHQPISPTPIAIITVSSISMVISSKLLRISSSRYSARLFSSSRIGHTTTGPDISDHEAFNYTSGR